MKNFVIINDFPSNITNMRGFIKMSNAEKGVEKYYTNQGFYLDFYLESLGKMTKISDKEDCVSKPQSN